MLVDDEPFFLEQLKHMINAYSREEGVSIDVIAECNNGQEALHRISETRPEAVISDIRMSVMDGIELARAIQERSPHLSVVIVSGYPSFDYAREAMRTDVVDYLLKPIDSAAFKKVLGRLIKKVENEKYDRLGRMMKMVIRSSKEPPADIIRELTEAVPDFRAIIVKNPMSQTSPSLLGSPYDHEDTAFRSSLHSLLRADEDVWHFSSDPNRYSIIIVKVRHDDPLRWQTILRHVQQFFRHAGSHSPSLTCSRALNDWLRLPAHIHELIKYLQEHMVIGRSRILHDPDSQDTYRKDTYKPALTEIDELRLTSLYQHKNSKELKSLLMEWAKDWEARQTASVQIEINLKHILRLLTQLNLTQTGERTILNSP